MIRQFQVWETKSNLQHKQQENSIKVFHDDQLPLVRIEDRPI